MAKELPYFEFEPNQWENGNIQSCSREDKGLFIDLCSVYWSRLGDLPVKLAVRKLCDGNASALDSLCDEGIIEIIDGNIFIKFLSIQLSKFDDISSQNSKNAKIRWEKHRQDKVSSERNASASNPQCESDAIREENRIEEEIKKDKIIEDNILLEKESKSDLDISILESAENNSNQLQIYEQNQKKVAGKKSIDERIMDFKKQVFPFVDKFGVEMCKAFFDYWSEKNPNGTKFKKEMQKTFEIEKRLNTWNNNNFGQKNKQLTKSEERSKKNMDIITRNMEFLKNRNNGTTAITE